MYVLVNAKSYRQIKNLKFSCDADVTGIEVHINSFSVEIRTDEDIETAQQIDLINERTGALWARYWITDSLRVNRDYVKIEAESVFLFLDRITMPAEYYDEVEVIYGIRQIFSELVDAYGGANRYYGWTGDDIDLWTRAEQPDTDDACYDDAAVMQTRYRVQSYSSLGYITVTVDDGQSPAIELSREIDLDYYYTDRIYKIDPDLQAAWENMSLDGFVPEQTARERLQWILFTTGAYAKTFFTETVEFKLADMASGAKFIPDESVFWRPTLQAKENVTALVIKSFSFAPAQGDPGTTEKWVEDEYGNVYIQTEQEFKLEAPDLPVTTPPNEVKIENVTIVNANNVNVILNRLANLYFKRLELEADVINGGEFLPGEKVGINNLLGEAFIGFIKSADFIFGKAQKSKLLIAEYMTATARKLTIIYADEGEEVTRVSYLLPPGFVFSIENIYPDIQKDSTRTIYYPVNDYAEGTMELESDTTITEVCHPALRQVKKKLYVYDVDTGSFSEDTLRIG